MARPTTVLIVDDDPDLLQLLKIRMQRAGFAVEAVESALAALTAMERAQPDVVVTDLKMSGMDGMALLTELESRFPVLPVILLTAHGTIPDAVAATKEGAFAFLTKPFADDELMACIRDAVSGREVSQNSNESATDSPTDWRAAILTRSSAMEALLQEAKLAAASDASVIIQSESGTGKELLASAIHAASTRASNAFVAVNCTAIPEALIESELFGHVKGAFTGAHQERHGLFLQAHGGTLFLDEIGDMPLSFQAKLLRALQERSIRPVGSDESIEVDVRVVTATHHDLEAAVERGEFREDLFYRLSVVTLELPRLAERRPDIPLLANHFLQQFSADGVAKRFSNAAMERLIGAPWPGNVRQLANVVQQCMVLSRTPQISVSLVDRALRGKPQAMIPFATARDRFETEYLSNLLQITNGNVSQSARLAGRNRSEFYSLLKRHALEPARFRGEAGGDIRTVPSRPCDEPSRG